MEPIKYRYQLFIKVWTVTNNWKSRAIEKVNTEAWFVLFDSTRVLLSLCYTSQCVCFKLNFIDAFVAFIPWTEFYFVFLDSMFIVIDCFFLYFLFLFVFILYSSSYVVNLLAVCLVSQKPYLHTYLLVTPPRVDFIW